MELFSDYFNQLLIEDKNFNNPVICGAYLIGAYSKGIIDSSFNLNGAVVQNNESFKRWLSNQALVRSNLKKIYSKACYFERVFHLDTKRNRDLSELVTSYFKDTNNIKIPNQEISYMFIRGFNDYAKFKKENKFQGENNE